MSFIRNIFYWSAYLLLRAVALIPFRVLYLFSDFLSLLVYHVVRYRRKVVEENLQRSFPEKTDQERRVIARKFYRNLCDQMLETIKMFGMSRKQISRRFRISNPEVLTNLPPETTGVCVATGHFGNWEWLGSLEGTAPTHFLSLYHTLRNPVADRLMLRLRQRFGAELVSMKNSMKPIIQHHRAGNLFAMCFIIDQSPKSNAIEYWTRFLNQDTAVFLGLEKIAVKFDFAVIYACIKRKARGRYEVEASLICEHAANTKPYEITEAHVRMLEQDIRSQPESWLWSHRRWKHKKPVMP